MPSATFSGTLATHSHALGKYGVLVRGIALLVALRSLRPCVNCHSVAQSLRDGFARRGPQLRAYLSQPCSRFPEALDSTSTCQRPLARLARRCGLDAFGLEGYAIGFNISETKYERSPLPRLRKGH